MLNNPENATSKGLAMMAKMGFAPGSALGKDPNARTEPVQIVMKEDRGGIGLDTERKRKLREEAAREGKRVKEEEGEYRDRIRTERETLRLESLVGAAMRVAESLDEEREGTNQAGVAVDAAKEDGMTTHAHEQSKYTANASEEPESARRKRTKPLKQVNVLWRGLVRRREEKERDRRMRYDLHQSISRLPTYDDPDEDKDDKRALGKDRISYVTVEDLEEDDAELEEFSALEAAERLNRLVTHLRKEHHYCFWCKYQYANDAMEGCPGFSEEDHD
jgi:hypothetical protein